MPSLLAQLQESLGQTALVLVRVDHTQGSVPREAGAWMAVTPTQVINTIGGGHLEFQAIEEAHALLRQPTHESLVLRYPLGPSLGQCCGGVVHLRFEHCDRLTPEQAARQVERLQAHHQPVALFGGGHVGRALIQVLSALPFDITWIDSRDEIFPHPLPVHVRAEHSDPVQSAVDDLAPGSQVLIMSFSHAEDLEVVAACLRRQRLHNDLAFVGLIGSATKWATFKHRLEARGFEAAELDRITCPIGLPGIAGKEPEVIAVAVAAQLLQSRPTPGRVT
ncbi:MAG: xanthine dehydrogenase accessory protein XdhC [Pseudomonadota bacterium]